MDLFDRFEAKFIPEPNSGCWLWTAATTGHGYGLIHAGGRLQYAHRISYEMHNGPIPPGLDIDHLCRVRCCVNPDHLEPVTRKENINRGIVADVHRARHALTTHCPRGHQYDAENTYFNGTSRCCRACGRDRARRRRT